MIMVFEKGTSGNTVYTFLCEETDIDKKEYNIIFRSPGCWKRFKISFVNHYSVSVRPHSRRYDTAPQTVKICF